MQRFAAVAENISKQQGLRHPVFLKIGKSIYLHSSFSLLFFFFFYFYFVIYWRPILKYHTYHSLAVNRSQSLCELANDIIELGNQIN